MCESELSSVWAVEWLEQLCAHAYRPACGCLFVRTRVLCGSNAQRACVCVCDKRHKLFGMHVNLAPNTRMYVPRHLIRYAQLYMHLKPHTNTSLQSMLHHMRRKTRKHQTKSLCTHACTCTHARTRAPMHAYVHTCMHTCTHVHTCMHTCTHVCIGVSSPRDIQTRQSRTCALQNRASMQDCLSALVCVSTWKLQMHARIKHYHHIRIESVCRPCMQSCVDC
jgi:hypothetical protein